MITADPNTLRYGAHRFAAAAQEMKRQAIQLEQATSIARQGQDGWTGEGSQAFVMRGERLVHDANKASQAFESVANTMIRFAMRMERVLDLRRRADQLDQQAFEYGDETLDSIHTRQHLRHQAAQLRHQADSEASVADSQAAKEFQMIAQMVPATLIPGADASTDLLEGLPKHWQDYYRRHPELLEEEKGAPPLTMGSYKQTDELATQRYLSQKSDEDRSFTEKLQDHMAGGVDAGKELIYELLYSVVHPIETVENVAYAVMHPDLVVQRLSEVKDDFISDWNQGNTYGWSKAVYKLALSVLGVKGAGLSDEAATTVTNAVSRIEFYNNLLTPAHKVVLPDGTVLRVSERVIQSNEEFLSYFEGIGKIDDTPTAFKQTEFASSYEARYNQTPSPDNRTVGFEGQRGESKCTLKPPPDPGLKKILDEAGIDGINYKNAVPDFSPVAKAQLEIDHMVGGVGSNGTKSRAANFKQADIKFAQQLNNSPEMASQFGLTSGKIRAGDIADIREEFKLTWHELNDGKTMQLVPSEINSKFGHLGGVGEINAGAFKPGGFANN